MRVHGGFVAIALGTAALVIAGCGSTATSPPAQSASTPAPTASASPVGSASAAISPGLPSGIPGVDVVMDPALLGVLPAAIGAATVEIEPESFGEAVSDASFVSNVDAAAFAVVADGEDLASGVVAHLRPDVYSEAFFRDWRDSYDEGACDQAGGVTARAEVGGEDDPTVHVTTCAGGLRVYHAYLPERGVVVSLFSLGERRFGEQLMAGLRP